MNKQQAEEHLLANLKEGDAIVGFFQAVSPANIWLLFLIGPLFILSMKIYFVAISQQGIYFHKLSLLGKFKECDFFAFSEIENVAIGKGLLQRPMKFLFKNDRKLKLKAQLKGVEKVAKLTADVQQHIEANIAQA